MSDQDRNEDDKKSRERKAYTTDQKSEAVDYAKKYSKISASKMSVYLQWIVEAWDILSKKLITESFKLCGITNSTYGSEDDKIRCFEEEKWVSVKRKKTF
uniref:DDE-1 domain-containing protein n=1 Tax=Ditylenchus dipsaci TaxID=166011 RepID=A0A915CP22_9BILA